MGERWIEYFGKSTNGVEVTLHVDVDPGKTPAEIASYAAAMDAELKKNRFTRSDRFDKAAFGGGGGYMPKAKTPAPPEYVVPEHCDVPMDYVPEKPRQGKDPVAAHWDCSKGKGCADLRDGKYPFTNWHLNITPEAAAVRRENAKAPAKEKSMAPELQAAIDHAEGKPTSIATARSADRPMTAPEKQQFWQATRDMGYTRDRVFEIAADVMTGQGPAMKDTEFTKLADASKVSVHRVFARLKELHEAASTS